MNFPQSWRLNLLLVLLLIPGSVAGQQAAGQSADSLIVHLGNGYEALKQEQYETAEKEFRAALSIDPSLAMRARFPLAVALFEEHKFADSRQEFVAVRQVTGEQPGISYYLGRLDLEERNSRAPLRISQGQRASSFPGYCLLSRPRLFETRVRRRLGNMAEKSHPGESRRLSARNTSWPRSFASKDGKRKPTRFFSRPRTRKLVATSRAS